MNIDERLVSRLRTPRTHPTSLLLGPSGRRLWVDLLDDAPGFRGAIDYVHKLNIPLLFTVGIGREPDAVRSEGEWLPSHLRTRQNFGAVRVDEQRFVTWTDEAVSIQEWTNGSDRPVVVRASFDESWAGLQTGPAGDAVVRGERRIEAHGFTLTLSMRASDPALWKGVTLQPGEQRSLRIVAALRHRSDDPADPVIDEATGWDPRDESLLDRQIAQYQEWFDDVPDLRSDSPLLDRAWAYRWYILRNTLAQPEMGRLRGTIAYEGRSHKMTKTPWSPTGWEFSKLIPLSTPFHALDLRWYATPQLGSAVLDAVRSVQGEDGQLYASTVTREIKPYASFFGHALAQFARVHGRHSVSEEAVATARRQVLGEREALTAGDDELPVQRDHKLTGKEYQPSYWAFHDFPADPTDPETFTPLKRVDRAVYQLLNARGVLELEGAEPGDERADAASRVDDHDVVVAGIADTLARSIVEKMWDPGIGFFSDLRPTDDAPAPVRNVVGFYPWWAEIDDERHTAGLRSALEPDGFGTPLPFPSTEVAGTAFRAQGGWMGAFLKGRNGCMWNGPAWPYTTGIALEALASASLRHGLGDVEAAFDRHFWSYLRSHFRDGDLAQPYLVEHYDPLTGEPLSDEPDYSHSSLIDLVVTRIVGLRPGAAGWELRPIDVGAGPLRLTDVPVRDHRVDVLIEAGHARVSCGSSVLFDGAVGVEPVPLPWAEAPCQHGTNNARCGRTTGVVALHEPHYA